MSNTNTTETSTTITSGNKEWTFDGLGIASIERPKSERGTFHRFCLKVDGNTYWLETKRSLCKWLSVIRSPIAPEVFRNLGKGVTINFDN
jgi:hypothetical protein